MKLYTFLIYILLNTVYADDEEPKVVIPLFQRPTLPLNIKTNTVDLYLGLTQDHNVSSLKLPFVVDFNSDNIVVNQNISCTDLGICKEDTSANSVMSYKTLIALAAPQIVSPSEIDEDVATTISNSRIKVANNQVNQQQNVLGLSPVADAWVDWNSEYYIRYDKVNITYHRYPNHEFMVFDSKIRSEDVMVIGPKGEKLTFPASFAMDKLSGSVNICVKTDKAIYFELNDDLYNKVKDALCKSSNSCETEDDLSDDVSENVTVTIKSHESDDILDANIPTKNLYFVNKNTNQLTLNFNKNTDSAFASCDIILQQRFFEHYYLLISNDINNSQEILVGLKRIYGRDFYINNIWKWVLIPTCILLAIGSTLYWFKNIRPRRYNLDEYEGLIDVVDRKHKKD